MEEREKLLKHMWDVYMNSKRVALPSYWKDAFVAAYEDLTSEVPEVQEAAITEIARMSIRYNKILPTRAHSSSSLIEREGSAETRMAKCLKLRICRAVASTMQSCRSKEPSTLPQNPDLKHQIPRAYLKHHVSSSQEFEWKKESKWHVVDKICEKRTPRREMKMGQDFPPPPFEVDRKKRRVKKKKNVPSRLRVSNSSGDSGWFSSEGAGDERDEEETETLVSSNSMNISPAKESAQPFSSQHRNNKRRPVASMRRRGTTKPPPEADGEIPARLSMLKKLIPCTVDGKVKESFAVVKKSEDPYEDFKNSMMDMILEKQMFEDKDLEQLLQCFLSLNSRHYHGIIVQAFCEIWDTIFTPSSPHQ